MKAKKINVVVEGRISAEEMLNISGGGTVCPDPTPHGAYIYDPDYPLCTGSLPGMPSMHIDICDDPFGGYVHNPCNPPSNPPSPFMYIA